MNEEDKKKRRAYMRTYQKVHRKKKRRVEVQLDPSDLHRIKREANRHQMKTATFIRQATLAYLDQAFIVPDPAQIRSLELALRRIGNNLNQLTARAHKYGLSRADLVDLHAMLRGLEHEMYKRLRDPEKDE